MQGNGNGNVHKKLVWGEIKLCRDRNICSIVDSLDVSLCASGPAGFRFVLQRSVRNAFFDCDMEVRFQVSNQASFAKMQAREKV